MSNNPVFTIGHSNRESVEFLELVSENKLELIVDVRKLAGSNRYPQFNADTLEKTLVEHKLAYRRFEPLTGRRPVSKTVPFEVNAWWQNRSFHNYADHALSSEFHEAVQELRLLADECRVAVMCSEAVWWRCHRRIIADHLLATGDEVIHILGHGQRQYAELSAGAVVSDGEDLTSTGRESVNQLTVTYPAAS